MNAMRLNGLVVLRSVIWGMGGALFGTLFAGLLGILLYLEVPPVGAMIAAIAGAGAVTAAFYGAMKVALVGTLAGALSSIATLVLFTHPERLLPVALIAAAAGALAGVLYTSQMPLPERPLAQSLSGLTAGLLSGLLLQLLPPLPIALLAGLAAAGVGAGHRLLTGPLLATCSRLMPSHLSTPLVAALIAAVVGASVWLIGSSTAGILPPERIDALWGILDRLPSGLFGGALGGALTGMLLELFGVAWRPESG